MVYLGREEKKLFVQTAVSDKTDCEKTEKNEGLFAVESVTSSSLTVLP